MLSKLNQLKIIAFSKREKTGLNFSKVYNILLLIFCKVNSFFPSIIFIRLLTCSRSIKLEGRDLYVCWLPTDGLVMIAYDGLVMCDVDLQM